MVSDAAHIPLGHRYGAIGEHAHWLMLALHERSGHRTVSTPHVLVQSARSAVQRPSLHLIMFASQGHMEVEATHIEGLPMTDGHRTGSLGEHGQEVRQTPSQHRVYMVELHAPVSHFAVFAMQFPLQGTSQN